MPHSSCNASVVRDLGDFVGVNILTPGGTGDLSPRSPYNSAMPTPSLTWCCADKERIDALSWSGSECAREEAEMDDVSVKEVEGRET